MTKPLWQPTAQAIAKSNMMRFLLQVKLHSYTELYQWSIEHPEQFWLAVWQFCDVKASKSWDKVLVNPKQMPGAKWFEGAKLNFAENLLRRRDDKVALVFRDENGARKTLSYAELYIQVAQLASAMRKAGIVTGDRVAGLLPNCPEAVIAMLATASIGAIWSSCSPDFGANAILDRFSQITPKLLFSVENYSYNGKTYDIREKNSILQQKLSTKIITNFETYVPKNFKF